MGKHKLIGQAELLDAIVRGYDATIRLGRAVGPQHYRFFHNTGTCGPIGAAVAGSAILGHKPERTAHAMALAMSQASGLWQTRHEPRSMGKQLHTSHAARAGIDSALLAEDGFKGPVTILEGEQGFFAATCGSADPNAVLDDNPRWRIHDVSFKPWPACRHAHAAIDAALAIREGVDPSTVESVVVETYRDALVFCDRPEPKTVIEAKFSLQHAVAVALLNGEPTLDDFSDKAVQDETLARLREKILVRQDEELTATYPNRFGARVMVDDREVFIADALGDPENPIQRDQLHAKIRMLLETRGTKSEALKQQCSRLLRNSEPVDPEKLAVAFEEALR
ncbi:hypothetical protein GCM10007148_03750 [Parvularcula lutaonensis]|nr:hypothetical protein GCM10007148_03750 [Parvularcula lutaonensis]